MGGNALKLKGLTPLRIPDKDLKGLIDEISDKLIKEEVFKWILPTKTYNNKTDHGDLDLIGELCKPNQKNPLAWHLKAKKVLNSKEIHWNKPVASLEYLGYQIDLTGRDTYQKAKTHLEFSHFSPLGNILGRLIRKTGAKWGINGLEYQISEKESPESHILKTLCLSEDINQILLFCGLNPKTWQLGFDNQEDIFQYACQSKLFNKEIFKLENLNHTHRKRDRTRPDYHQWLNFLEKKEVRNNTHWNLKETPSQYSQRITQYQLVIDKEFPTANLLGTIKEERSKNDFIKLQKKEKFNGSLISKWTGLQKQELGEFIKAFKKEFNLSTPNTLIKWIVSTDKGKIKDLVKSYQLDYNRYLKENID